MVKKANVFIVGAQKSGTTSIYKFLSQHNDIYFPNSKDFPDLDINFKEPSYFLAKYYNYPHCGIGDNETDSRFIKDFNSYSRLYSKCGNQKCVIDSSINYLYFPEIANDIYEYNNDAKIIIFLRDPIDRAYSAYTHLVRDNRETLTFSEGIHEEEKRLAMNYSLIWAYKNYGLYYKKVKEYIDVFGRNKVLIVLFEDIKKNIDGVLELICDFLQINKIKFTGTDYKYNISGIPKKNFSTKLYTKVFTKKSKKIIRTVLEKSKNEKLLRFLRKKLYENHLVKHEISKDTKNYLYQFFKSDVDRLSALINRDLSHWMKK